MASKAERRRRKIGRPKQEGVAREPNGRISRSVNDNNTAEIARRAERLGLTVVQARDPKAATYIGYLNILGRVDGISDDQYDAAMKFLDLRRSYLLAIKAPNSERSDEATGNTNSEVSDSYIEWCQKAKERYKQCREAIQDYQNQCRQNLWAALDLCIIQGHRQDHMIGDIRMVCNALIVFFRV